MGIYQGDNNDNTFNLEGQALQGGTGHSYYGYGGNDTVYGSSYVDFIIGGDGDDVLYGYGNDDYLQGDGGADYLSGGAGNDNLGGGIGNDHLFGGSGNDLLRGNQGNDLYEFAPGLGIDTIDESQGPAGLGGEGGGSDFLYFGAVASAIALYQSGNDLLVTTANEMADGIFDDGVIIADFFLGGDHVVETLLTSDNMQYDLTVFL
ncbi:hypothetical protein SAMN06297251_107150 [Fulvimarina manganoxydans]|uniref:Hemolysin-type calcium-binding repeat-containing protein n=1 Tax=Fulvimarina manganoxydans TaxID=937218 RepID=A0A1W2BU57_9HYPH|nr:calcium-binding protein [Fulvimarina manganoxydans]SMC76493.1 hypothetical protein SAMN06297251_107150 [Fulvimarina manganoxydans]